MNQIFESLIKSKIEKFYNDYIDLSRQIFVNEEGTLIHPGEFGTYREKIIKSLLQPFLPSRLDIGSGFIITAKDNISTQCDIVIYDKANTPVIETEEQRFFPIECVVGVIEVKSKLNKSTFKEALRKLAKIKELKNDIGKCPYIFKNFVSSDPFNPKDHIKDQMATFLICESIDMDFQKEINTFFKEAYKEIDKSLYHNMILSLNDGCFMYYDENGRPIYYPYFDYDQEVYGNELEKPHPKGYDKEHIMLFINYFFMIISSVSVMFLEITNYLGSQRPKTALKETN